jgi:hypothetical protein
MGNRVVEELYSFAIIRLLLLLLQIIQSKRHQFVKACK